MPDVALKGRLKSGIVAIGGETTGFALENASLATSTLEIDVSSIPGSRDLSGANVLVVGDFEIHNYVNRGRVLVFKAKSVVGIRPPIGIIEVAPEVITEVAPETAARKRPPVITEIAP